MTDSNGPQAAPGEKRAGAKVLSDLGALWPAAFGAAIFDFDGTLAATEDLWEEVDRIYFGERGIAYDELAHQTLATLGFAPGAEWVRQTYGLDEPVEDICDEWNRLGHALYATRVELRPGAREYLAALRETGVPMALATTNDPYVLSAMKPHVDVDEIFDAVVCGKEVARPKDHPDIYLEAARRIGAAPSACMVFEDILPGVRSARRCGMRACAVRCADERQPREALRREADLWLDDWRDIPLP